MTSPNRITEFAYTLEGQWAVLIARNTVTGIRSEGTVGGKAMGQGEVR